MCENTLYIYLFIYKTECVSNKNEIIKHALQSVVNYTTPVVC